MVRSAIVVVAVVLALMPCPHVQAADINAAGPGVRLVTTGTEVAGDRACYVLWALSHGPYANYTPSGWYSDLVDMLEMNNIISYEADYDLNYIGLDSYDIIVVGTLLAWDSAYTAAELTAIQDFVSAGGGLLIMGENSDCPNEHINIISEAYGVTCPLTGGDVNGHITDFAGIDLFTGVTTLELIGSPGLTVGYPGAAVAWASGGQPVVAIAGPCEVIVVSDGNVWENDYIATGDNETCALNVFDCLCSSDTGAQNDSSWGLVKALFR